MRGKPLVLIETGGRDKEEVDKIVRESAENLERLLEQMLKEDEFKHMAKK